MNITPHIEKPLNLGWNQARITVALSLLLVVTALAVLIYTVAEVLPSASSFVSPRTLRDERGDSGD